MASERHYVDRYTEYKDLLELRLRPLLEERSADFSKAQVYLSEWSELHEHLQALHRHGSGREEGDADKPFKCLVDVGSGFRQAGRIDDTSKVFINIGCDVYPELELSEALAFVGRKVELLRRLVDDAREALVRVQADLTVAQAALSTLSS